MAINFLPILLVGGAAAVVVSQSSKKKKAKAAKKCPPTTVITLGELRIVTERAVAKYGTDSDPAREANYIVNEVLPPGCSRSSSASKVKIQIPNLDKGFEMTIPDVYMLTFAQSITARVDSERLAKPEADKLWARELDWYKKLTGVNFDAERTGIAELAKALLNLIKDSIESAIGMPKRTEPIPPKLGGCPSLVTMGLASFEFEASMIANDEIKRGAIDPFKIADKAISELFPKGCSKSDYTTTVNLTSEDGQAILKSTDMAALYGMTAWAMCNKLNLSGLIKDMARERILFDYKNLTGKEFPEKYYLT